MEFNPDLSRHDHSHSEYSGSRAHNTESQAITAADVDTHTYFTSNAEPGSTSDQSALLRRHSFDDDEDDDEHHMGRVVGAEEHLKSNGSGAGIGLGPGLGLEPGQSRRRSREWSRSGSVSSFASGSTVASRLSDESNPSRPFGDAAPSLSGPAMTLEQRKAMWWRSTMITGCGVIAWYTFATLLSLYNKWMFSPQYYGFSYPLFVTGCHMVVQFVLAGTIRMVWAKTYRPKERPTRREYVLKIFPTALSTGGDIGLSNLSLKTITLSLYTMCKSSTLIFVLMFAFLFRLEKYSLRLILVISLITFGVFLMVLDTTSVNIPGIIMVFSASALSGLRWALTETVMHKQSMGLSNPFATIFWLAPLSAVVLAVVSAGIEGWGTIFASDFFVGSRAFLTVLVIVFPGTLAFAMVASEYFIIQRAGIIPLSIAGMFKEVSTISISALVFGDQLTPVNISGVAIAVVGIGLYTYHKYQKSIASPVPLRPHGEVIDPDDARNGLAPAYTSVQTEDQDDHRGNPPVTPSTRHNGLPMTALNGPLRLESPQPHSATNGHGIARAKKSKSKKKSEQHQGRTAASAYPPKEVETAEELADRRRDEFEGWANADGDGDEDGDEAGYDLTEAERAYEAYERREAAKSRTKRSYDDGDKVRGKWMAWWVSWWGKSM